MTVVATDGKQADVHPVGPVRDFFQDGSVLFLVGDPNTLSQAERWKVFAFMLAVKALLLMVLLLLFTLEDIGQVGSLRLKLLNMLWQIFSCCRFSDHTAVTLGRIRWPEGCCGVLGGHC